MKTKLRPECFFMGKMVRKLRESMSVSQDNLAECIGVNRVSMNLYENGINQIPIGILMKLCAIFEVTPNDILPPVPKVKVNKKITSREPKPAPQPLLKVTISAKFKKKP